MYRAGEGYRRRDCFHSPIQCRVDGCGVESVVTMHTTAHHLHRFTGLFYEEVLKSEQMLARQNGITTNASMIHGKECLKHSVHRLKLSVRMQEERRTTTISISHSY